MSEQRGKGRGRGKRINPQQPSGPSPRQAPQPSASSASASTSSASAPAPAPAPAPSSSSASASSSAPASSTSAPIQRQSFADVSGSGTQRTRDASGDVAQLGRGIERIRIQTERAENLPTNRGGVRGRRTLPTEPVVLREVTLSSKKGSTGENIVVISNYFKLPTTTDWCLHQYHVDFAPEEDRTAVRKALMRCHRETFGAYVFDGSLLYSNRRFNDEMELFSTRSSDNEHIRLKVRLVGELSKGHYQYIQFFNLIVRKCFEGLNLQLVGRNYYNTRDIVDIVQHQLQLWPGYVTSIRQHERDILMCTEITHKVMRRQTLLDILHECHARDNRQFRNHFNNAVIGSTVLTKYNNATYRIEDVNFQANPRSTFAKRNGDQISYMDYYQSRYGLRISNESQPLLVTRSKPKSRQAEPADLIYLIPEFCLATGLTDDMTNDVQLMRDVAVHTRMNPQTRIQKLMELNRILLRNEAIVRELNSWNLSLENKLLEFPARKLPAENLHFGGNAVITPKNGDWSREMQNKKCLINVDLNDWVLIVGDRDKESIQGFLGKLVQVSNQMSFMIKRPRLVYIQNDSASQYAQKLEEVLSQNTPQLIFCVVSNNRADRYTAIKKKCCVDRPVPSQVYLKKNLFHKNIMSIATKVAIQMNCKLGGSPWCVDIPIAGLMVIGFDVCHDPTSKGKDFGAMVASLDSSYSRYYSAVNLHDKTQELSNEFAANISKALHAYQKHNKTLPKRIIIYRDGVGEGQVQYVLDHEVEDIKNRLRQIYGGDTYKMAFIIVNKRIHTRFFTVSGNNPVPGTVVDDFVTCPTKFDFFIVSQQVKQGTITPTSYSIIYENCNLNADKLQWLTFKLTHMYFNTSCTVRVPAPCHYAHKLAFLVAKYIHQSPHSQLENTLYFL